MLDAENRVGQGRLSVLKLLLVQWIREIIWCTSHLPVSTISSISSNLLAFVGALPLHLRMPPRSSQLRHYPNSRSSWIPSLFHKSHSNTYTCSSRARPITSASLTPWKCLTINYAYCRALMILHITNKKK